MNFFGGAITDLGSIRKEYSWELKENLVRRAIASVIDHILVSLITIFIGGFAIVGILSANPMGAVLGLMGDVLMKFDNAGLKYTPLFLAMLVFAGFYAFFTTIYFTVLESGGRRTPGKILMHLEVTGVVDPDPSMKDAFLRNMGRIAAGALGAYILGIVGANLFTAVTLIVEYFGFGVRKIDLRQRYLDVGARTIVLFDDDEVEIAEIRIDGAPTIEDLINARKMSPGAGAKTPASQGLGAKGFKPAAPMLGSPPRSFGGALSGNDKVEEAPTPAPRPAFGRSMALSPTMKRSDEPPVEQESQIPKKEGSGRGFLSGLFGGRAKAVKEQETPPEEEKEPPEPPQEGSRDMVVLSFMMDLDIDEDRAHGLYIAGYRHLSELSEAIPEDLIMIKGINPTMARRIISAASGGSG